MRPTKYNDDVLKQAKDYLQNYEKHGHPFPSIVGLSIVLGLAKSTVSAWKNDDDKPEFSDTLEKIKDQQHVTLLNKGLTGEFNASITKLMLHNFGYSERRSSSLIEKEPIKVILNTKFD
ncbi:DNA-packaging protein [Marinicella meishanensis]|uniref:DNA-packaging protein n=1 Tax=Marinicella meishanensis TaxID=2873263 RepID=UPI001CC12E29|nr:DNA-packaging protein [Marinicella sp. NBU2979]